MLVDGQPHALDGYKRFDNPFVQVDFDTTRYEVEAEGYSLVLDFATDTREAAAPTPDLNLPWWLLWLLGVLG